MEDTDSANEGEDANLPTTSLATADHSYSVGACTKRKGIDNGGEVVTAKKAKEICMMQIVNDILMENPTKQYSNEEICQAVHLKDPDTFKLDDNYWKSTVHRSLYRSKKARRHPGGVWSAKYKKSKTTEAPIVDNEDDWEDDEPTTQPTRRRMTGMLSFLSRFLCIMLLQFLFMVPLVRLKCEGGGRFMWVVPIHAHPL